MIPNNPVIIPKTAAILVAHNQADELRRALGALEKSENRELLEMWCNTTAITIFPRRKIGKLKPGYEASFLVLKKNPLQEFTAIQQISLRVKQGRILHLDPEQKP